MVSVSSMFVGAVPGTCVLYVWRGCRFGFLNIDDPLRYENLLMHGAQHLDFMTGPDLRSGMFYWLIFLLLPEIDRHSDAEQLIGTQKQSNRPRVDSRTSHATHHGCIG